MLYKQKLKFKCQIGAVLVICLYCSSLAGANGNASNKYNQSIKQISKEIEKVTENLNANQALLKSERDKLSELEREILKGDANLTETKAAVVEIETKLEKINQDYEGLKLKHAKDLTTYKTFVKNQYLNGRTNYLQMILNQRNPYAVGRLNNYFNYFQEDKKSKLRQITAQLSELSNLRDLQAKNLNELASARAKQANLANKLQESKRHRSLAVNALSKKVETSSSKLRRLKKDRERLDSLIKDIAKQAARMKEEALAREREQKRNNSIKPTTKPLQIKRTLVKGGFSKQKGRLNYPVNAGIRYGYGARVPESGMRAQGVFFDTQGSQPVRSIFRGRVLFADYLKGYGLMLIIDHGDEHISLYGHNELIYKKVGDMVDTGEVVSTSGMSGGLKSAGVYFEIRKNAVPVNPTTWCR